MVYDHLHHWVGKELNILAFLETGDEVATQFRVLEYVLNVDELKLHWLQCAT